MAAGSRVVWMPGGVRTEVRLTAEDTDGALCLLVDHPPAGWLLPGHIHHNEAETIHIVEGSFEMTIDG
jgi:anti-sigma factor ChrR (cupin superfamily)